MFSELFREMSSPRPVAPVYRSARHMKRLGCKDFFALMDRAKERLARGADEVYFVLRRVKVRVVSSTVEEDLKRKFDIAVQLAREKKSMMIIGPSGDDDIVDPLAQRRRQWGW